MNDVLRISKCDPAGGAGGSVSIARGDAVRIELPERGALNIETARAFRMIANALGWESLALYERARPIAPQGPRGQESGATPQSVPRGRETP